MATIAKLVLRIEAETQSLRAQLKAASSDVSRFAADMNRSFSKLPNLSSMTVGGQAVTRALAQVEADFNRTFAKLRNQAKKGALDPTDFANNLRAAVRAAKNDAQAVIGQLQQAGTVTGRQASGLIARSEQSAIRAETNILIGEAQQSLSRLESQFKSRQATLLTSRATGGIDTHEFAKLGAQAEAEFNTAWAAEMQRFSHDPRFTEPMRVAFAQQFKKGGFGFDPTQVTVAKSIDAAKAGADSFVRTYQKTVQSAKFGNLTGDLTGKQFRKALDDANKELARGLKQVRDTLDAQGLLTPEALKFLNSQFQNAGKTAATGFFEEFDKAMQLGSTRTLARTGTLLTQVGGTLTKFLSLPLGVIGGEMIHLAADSEQASRRLLIAFGPSSVQLSRNLNALRNEIPATSSELTQMAARLGELVIPLGLSSEASAEMATQLIKITKNISLFAGVPVERAFGAVINGLVGQSRELKKLGIEVDDRMIRDRAYRDGLARVGAQLSTTTKVMAGYRVILDRTRLIQNTLNDSSDTFNVRMLFFTARLKEAGISIAQIILPSLTRFLTFLTGIADRFGSLSDSQKRFVLGLGTFAVVIGPVIVAVGSLIRTLALYRAMLIAIEAVQAAAGITGAASGLAGIMGLAGFAAKIGPVVAIITAIAGAILFYKTAISGAGEEAAKFRREISGLSAEGLEQEKRGLQEAIKLNEAKVEALRKRFFPDVTADEFVHTGIPGSAGRQVLDQVTDLVKQTKAWKEQVGLVSKEIIDVKTQTAAADAAAADFAKRQKEAVRNSQTELLVEQLQRAQFELSNLQNESKDVRASITNATKLGDFGAFAEQIQRAEGLLAKLKDMSAQTHDLAITPEGAPMRKELEKIATSAHAAAKELSNFLLNANNSGAVSAFNARLSELRKQLELGKETGSIQLISKAFGGLVTLQEDVSRSMDEAARAGNEKLRASLSGISTSIELLRVKFEHFIPEEFLKSIDIAIDQLKLLKDNAPEGTLTSTGVPIEQMGQQAKLVERLVLDQDELNRQIAVEGRTRSDVAKIMAEIVKVSKTIKDNTPNLFEIMFGADFLPKIQEAADAIRVATDAAEAAKGSGDVAAARQAELDVIRAQAQFTALRRQFQASISGFNQALQSVLLKGFDDAFKKTGVSVGDTTDKLDKMGRRIARLGALVSVVRQIAEAFGLTGETLTKVVQSTSALISGIENLRRVNSEFLTRQQNAIAARSVQNPFEVGGSFSGPVDMNMTELTQQIASVSGILASAFNLVSSIANAILGRSETEIEHDRILQQNNERLAELNLTIDGFTGSIGDQLRVRGGLQNPGVVSAIQAGAFTGFLGNFGKIGTEQINVINARLKEFGITWEEVIRVAKDNGITLLDSKGRLVAGAFDQLSKAIELNRKHFFDYALTLDDLTKKTELFNNVFNVPDTGDQAVTDALSQLATLAPDLFKQFFSGIDLNDMTAVEGALQAFTQALLDGTLEASDSLKLLNRGEIETIITNMANGFDKLRDATDKLTESELNVPDWFKRAQVRFDSVSAMLQDRTAFEPTPTPVTRPVSGGPDNPPPPLGPKQAVDSVSADTFAAAKMTAALLDIEKITSPTIAVHATVADIPPIRVDATDLPKLTVALPEIPTLKLDVPELPKLTVEVPEIKAPELKVPEIPRLELVVPDLPKLELSTPVLPKLEVDPDNLPKLDVRLPEIPPLTVAVPTELPKLELALPDIPKLEVALPDLPKLEVAVPQLPDLKLDVPEIPPIAVQVADIPPVTVAVPDIPPITVQVADIPPVKVDLPDLPTLRVETPVIPPLTVDLPAIPPLVLSVPDIPPVRVAVDDIPPVRLVVPDIPPVSVQVPEIPPLQLTLPEIPELTLRLPDLADIANMQIADMIVNRLSAVAADIPVVAPQAGPSSEPVSVPPGSGAAAQSRAAGFGGDGPVAVSGGLDTGDEFNFYAPLVGSVVQQPGESVDDLADRIVARLSRRNFLRNGSSRVPGLTD